MGTATTGRISTVKLIRENVDEKVANRVGSWVQRWVDWGVIPKSDPTDEDIFIIHLLVAASRAEKIEKIRVENIANNGRKFYEAEAAKLMSGPTTVTPTLAITYGSPLAPTTAVIALD